MAKVFIKIDKNGTKWYSDDTCTKCGGHGRIYGYEHIEYGRCFKCGGTGIQPKPRTIKEYTPEYEAILEERRFKKAQAKAIEMNKEFFEKAGFNSNGFTYVVLGNTYEIKDELKEMGAKFNQSIGWHLPVNTEKFDTMEISIDDVYEKSNAGQYYWSESYKMAEVIKAENEKRKPKSKSEHLGNAGEKVDLIVTYTRLNWFDTQFGTTWVYTFVDENENVIVWKTGKTFPTLEVGTKVNLKGTIKGLDEYKGVKQTILTRCKIK